MHALRFSLLITASIQLCTSKTLSLDISLSSDDYAYTSVEWGTPGQSFPVLIDTTNTISWVYGPEAQTSSDSNTFDNTSSSTYQKGSTSSKFSYGYAASEINIIDGTDTLTVDGQSFEETAFALSKKSFNFSLFEEQSSAKLSGFLGLGRQSAVLSALDNESLTLDVSSDTLYLGAYAPTSSSIDSQSNATQCSDTNNDLLNDAWTFDIQIRTDNEPRLNPQTFKGVIDSASPFITVYAKSPDSGGPGIDELWQYIDKSYLNSDEALNCNYSTMQCSSTDIMANMTIILTADNAENYNVTFTAEDVLDGDTIKMVYAPDQAYVDDTDYVLFLGRPFLSQVMVTMTSSVSAGDTVTFFTKSVTSSSLNWVTIGIVFASVVAFAALFFGAYCFKYGRIPPTSSGDVEEQVSLLHGPAVALGQGNVQAVGSGDNAALAYSGLSGLDGDDEDELQVAMNRQGQIEAQQRRERQLREENERRQRQARDEQQQQARDKGAKEKKLGGKAERPADAEALRQRRLRFLEQQQQQQE